MPEDNEEYEVGALHPPSRIMFRDSLTLAMFTESVVAAKVEKEGPSRKRKKPKLVWVSLAIILIFRLLTFWDAELSR